MSFSLARARSLFNGDPPSNDPARDPTLDIEPPTSVVSSLSTPDLTLSQRMMSAGVGSIITAFILTPLDVIRIRMQQQEILPDSKPCCAEHFKQDLAKGRYNTLTSASASSTVASNTIKSEVALESPHLFWVDKGYCKTAPNCTRIDGTVQGFFTIARHEGLPTLWRGMSLTLLMAIPSNVIYFTGYEYIRDNSPISGSLNSLLCGASARLLAATAVAPIELIKTRLQSIPSSKSDKSVFRNVIRDSLNQVKTDGPITLFKGLQITLWRDVPFSGVYWSIYELSKKEFSSMLKADFSGTQQDFNNYKNDNESRVFLTSFLSGSLAGSVAAVVTHPFDVGKTRLQISQDSGRGGKQPTMFKFLHNIYKNEGMSALFGGLGPRVFKIAPACAIMISTYEFTKMFFNKS